MSASQYDPQAERRLFVAIIFAGLIAQTPLATNFPQLLKQAVVIADQALALLKQEWLTGTTGP